MNSAPEVSPLEHKATSLTQLRAGRRVVGAGLARSSLSQCAACCNFKPVDHPCSKCGATVEDGVPFCQHCHAPQIRVAIEVAPPSEGDLNPTAFPGHSAFPGQGAFQSLPKARIQWGRALPTAAIAGTGLSVILLLLRLPLALYILAFLTAGAVAVMLYRRRVSPVQVAPGMGAKIGAASGAGAFLFLAVVAANSISRDQLRKMLEQQISELTARGYNPEQAKLALDLLKTPEGLAFFVVFSLAFSALVFVGASALGGALGARFMSRRNRG